MFLIQLMSVIQVKADNTSLPSNIKSLMKLAYEERSKKEFFFIIEMLKKSSPELTANIKSYIAILEINNPKTSPKAQEEIADNSSPWKGEAEMNVLLTTGKSRIKYYGLKGKLTKDAGDLHHLLQVYYNLNKTNNIKNKQKIGGSYKLDVDISSDNYLLGLAAFEADEFGPFKQRFTTSFGIGYHLINNENIRWKIEGGPSYIITRNHPPLHMPSPPTLNEFSFRGSNIFTWKISENAEFANNFVLLTGKRNLIESKTSLKLKIMGSLYSKFSYDILYDKDAPLGSEKNNTSFRTGLSFEF